MQTFLNLALLTSYIHLSQVTYKECNVNIIVHTYNLTFFLISSRRQSVKCSATIKYVKCNFNETKYPLLWTILCTHF